MSVEQSESSSSYLWFAAMGLLLYCAVITAVTGEAGFDGDDWWVLACPYWNSFPDSLLIYARKFLRPVEGLYNIGLFELFGFNKTAFHFCSLLLAAGSAILLGVALHRAFPRRKTCISFAVLLAFFLPSVSCLTYVAFTDNSRLSMLLFWTAVIAFQRWARKSSTWYGLIPPALLYITSFLTYESAAFLIFTVPFLVWPVHRRNPDRPSDRIFFIRLFSGVLFGFVTALSVRFLFLSGGAVGHNNVLPPFELMWSYLALFPFYLAAPFTTAPSDGWALFAGLCALCIAAGLLFLSNRPQPGEAMAPENRPDSGSQWYVAVFGLAILFLGMLPYQLAGYGSFAPKLVDTLATKCGLTPGGDLTWFNFTWSSRIYSTASFGVAVLLAFGLNGWKNPSLQLIGKAATLVIIGFMAVFHGGLSRDWREAGGIRNDLMRSLITQVPAVEPGTNFLFLNLDCSHKRAEVIRRENGLRELVEMLYGDKRIDAWKIYPNAFREPGHVLQQATATPEGFVIRGQRQPKPSPLNSLLILKRSGRRLVLLNKIDSKDRSIPTGIAWNGVNRITSNFNRIETWTPPVSTQDRLMRNAWTTGLLSTLNLTRLTSATRLRDLRYVVVRNSRPKRFFKKQPHRRGAYLLQTPTWTIRTASCNDPNLRTTMGSSSKKAM